MSYNKVIHGVALVCLVVMVTFFSWNGIGFAKSNVNPKKTDKQQHRLKADKKRCMWFFPICLAKRSTDMK